MQKDTVRTLSTRMIAIYLTVTIGALLAVGVAVGTLLYDFFIRDRQNRIASELDTVVAFAENLGSSTVRDDPAGELDAIARAGGGRIEVCFPDGTYRVFDPDGHFPEEIPVFEPNEDGSATYTREKRGDVPSVSGMRKTERVAVRYSLSMLDIREKTETVAVEILLIILVTTLVAVVIVRMTTLRLTKPFVDMTGVVQRYVKGDYNLRIDVPGTQEAAELAESFNQMADEVRDLETTRRAFVQNVSHELRSPLTSMKGFLEAMQDGTIPANDYDRYIDIVLSETRRMGSMVNDLLDLARIESGKQALNVEVFELHGLIARTLLTFEARIYEKTMDVDVRFGAEQYYVEADSAQIEQVLRNIIDNAIKYSPDKSRICVTTSAVGKKIVVSIADNGQGIPKEDIPHIFDRFYKVEKAHTYSSHSGTGLGLSITRRIIEQHGETIELKSELGKGSDFTFTLKRANAPKQARNAQDGGKRNG